VPPGYTFGKAMFDTDVVRGGSAYGAGTFAGPDGSRQPTEIELEQARHLVRAHSSLVPFFSSHLFLAGQCIRPSGGGGGGLLAGE
jgi:hypothetical protein